MSLQAYTEQELFQPLGITDSSWSSDPAGITTGATGLALRPRDLARFGYLYLQQGQWGDTQVLPKEWVAASTSKHMETKGLMNAAEDDGYGYLWWIDLFGGYSAHGFGGQFIYVLPGLDMLVVFTGGLPDCSFPSQTSWSKPIFCRRYNRTRPCGPMRRPPRRWPIVFRPSSRVNLLKSLCQRSPVKSPAKRTVFWSSPRVLPASLT